MINIIQYFVIICGSHLLIIITRLNIWWQQISNKWYIPVFVRGWIENEIRSKTKKDGKPWREKKKSCVQNQDNLL